MKKLLYIYLFLTAFYLYAQCQEVTTVAGNGTEGYLDGSNQLAQFYNPEQIVADIDGNIFVADYGNHVIRKIGTDGIVSTYAGTGVPGDMDGSVGIAQFNLPIGLAIDGDGNIYVSDGENHKIKKITTDKVVYTVAGSGVAGYKDGFGDTAQFYDPSYIALDNNKNIFVADFTNQCIRKISPDRMVTTIAGKQSVNGFKDGPDTTARFNYPIAVAVDNNGNLYVSDRDNHAIRKINSLNIVTTIAGNGSAGYVNAKDTAARFNGPKGLIVDKLGNIYVADRLNYVIRKIVPNRHVYLLAGKPGETDYIDGDTSLAKFGRPLSLTIDKSGDLLISDYNFDVIRKFDLPEIPSNMQDLSFVPDQFFVYPVPAFQSLTIQVTNQNRNQTPVTVHMYNLSGKLLKTVLNYQPGSSIPIHLKSGMYVLEVLNLNSVERKIVMIQ